MQTASAATTSATAGLLERAEAALRPLYRFVLPPAPTLGVEPDPYSPLYQGAEADAALSGKVASARRRIPDSPIELLATAHKSSTHAAKLAERNWPLRIIVGAILVLGLIAQFAAVMGPCIAGGAHAENDAPP